MALISLTIPDDKLTRVLDAVCGLNGFTGTDANGQPQTKANFSRLQMGVWLKAQVRAWEMKQVTANDIDIS